MSSRNTTISAAAADPTTTTRNVVPADSTTTTSTDSTAPATAGGGSGGRLRKTTKCLVNHDYCYYCEEGGNLLNCDRCPASFHLMCHEPPLELDQVPKGEFLCNRCRANAALHAAASTAAATANQTPTTAAAAASSATNEVILLERQLLALPVSHETKTVEFELFEQESSINTLIRMAKSLNPRQMQLSKSITHECAFDLPGLNKLKWWKKEGNRIVNANVRSDAITAAAAAQAESSNSAIMNRLNAGPGDPVDPQAAQLDLSTAAASAAGLASAPLPNETAAGANTARAKSSGKASSSQTDTVKICFICQKNSDSGPLAKCGFCPLMYHLNCLNPPLCTMPPRDRLWMCPNHVEHFLDLNMLTSTRLTERMKLWQKYSLKKFDSQTVMLDFLGKCNNSQVNGLRESEETPGLVRPPGSAVLRPVKRCKVPDTIKLMYSRVREPEASQERQFPVRQPVELPETPAEVDNLELLAAQALSMLSHGADCEPKKSDSKEPLVVEAAETPTWAEGSVAAPPLYKACREAIKPRALLQYIPQRLVKAYRTHKLNHSLDIFLRKLLDGEELRLPAPFQLVYRSASIGQASNMDVCIDAVLRQSSAAEVEEARRCKFVSDKHACIYFDEVTNNYELLNFSQHGTTVDNCFYGVDLGLSGDDDDGSASEEESSDEPSMSAAATPGLAGKGCLASQPSDLCICEHAYRGDIASLAKGRGLWEGPAVLDHGSHLRIGCIDFLFIIVDYTFLDKTSSQRLVINSSCLPVSISSSLANKKRKSSSAGSRQRSSPTLLSNGVKRLRKDGSGGGDSKFRYGSKNASRMKKLRHKKSLKAQTKLDKLESLIDLVNNPNKKLLLNNY